MLLVNDTNDYQQLVRRDAETAAEEAGIVLEVQTAANDFMKQIRQIYDLVRREPEARPKFIFLFPVRDASLEHVLRDAARAGIGCAILNRRPKYLENLRQEFPGIALGPLAPTRWRWGVCRPGRPPRSCRAAALSSM
jgi:ABC-type sugar transport system substrate-binding protein